MPRSVLVQGSVGRFAGSSGKPRRRPRPGHDAESRPHGRGAKEAAAQSSASMASSRTSDRGPPARERPGADGFQADDGPHQADESAAPRGTARRWPGRGQAGGAAGRPAGQGSSASEDSGSVQRGATRGRIGSRSSSSPPRARGVRWLASFPRWGRHPTGRTGRGHRCAALGPRPTPAPRLAALSLAAQPGSARPLPPRRARVEPADGPASSENAPLPHRRIDASLPRTPVSGCTACSASAAFSRQTRGQTAPPTAPGVSALRGHRGWRPRQRRTSPTQAHQCWVRGRPGLVEEHLVHPRRKPPADEPQES